MDLKDILKTHKGKTETRFILQQGVKLKCLMKYNAVVSRNIVSAYSFPPMFLAPVSPVYS